MECKISVVINTLNEGKNINNAIQSVKHWADEIIVVDMYSDDGTADIARKLGAKVFFHERIGFVEPARQFAINEARNDWVLVLDADEIVPKSLSKLIFKIIYENKYDIINIPWLNYLLGTPLMYTGWGPNQDKHSRCFKKSGMEISSIIHKGLIPKPNSKIYNMNYREGNAVIHFNYVNTNHFIQKLKKYTYIEATQIINTKKLTIFVAIFRSIKELFNRYIIKKGYKDGWRGFYLSIAMAFYYLTVYANFKELEEFGEPKNILLHYQNIANDIISEYKIK